MIVRFSGAKPDFATVYDSWYDRVYKYAYTLLLNREDAEDVTAETVLRLFARLRPQERELLILRYTMELRDREIAAMLGLPEKTVNKQALRERLFEPTVELSLDELDAAAGGAALPEPESWCWSDDNCYLDEVLYDRPPCKKLCPRCGHGIAAYQYTHLFVAHYWCQGCHYPFEVTEIF